MKPFLMTIFALIATCGHAAAEALVASHTIGSRSLIAAGDVLVVEQSHPGALVNPTDAIGMEARVVLYAGRPIRADDLAHPAVIERNQIVPLVFMQGSLAITTDGRSLARAAIGDRIRVMNLASRTTVSGTVDPDGRVIVGSSELTSTTMERKR